MNGKGKVEVKRDAAGQILMSLLNREYLGVQEIITTRRKEGGKAGNEGESKINKGYKHARGRNRLEATV